MYAPSVALGFCAKVISTWDLSEQRRTSGAHHPALDIQFQQLQNTARFVLQNEHILFVKNFGFELLLFFSHSPVEDGSTLFLRNVTTNKEKVSELATPSPS